MDEEIIQRLIYIVIVVVIVIINYAVRSQKKKMQAAQQKQIAREADQEIPSPTLSNTKTIEKKINEVFSTVSNVESNTITSNNVQMSDSYIKKASRMESNYQSRMTKLQTKQTTTLDVEEEPFKFSNEELKKAIIYPEIITKRDY